MLKALVPPLESKVLSSRWCFKYQPAPLHRGCGGARQPGARLLRVRDGRGEARLPSGAVQVDIQLDPVLKALVFQLP